ncbi:MAG TPA: hypothetical protein VGY53_00455 [Isosphaeraceae bacterium]|nr:hypothetical protein [Isosphaeraceae bacterium]
MLRTLCAAVLVLWLSGDTTLASDDEKVALDSVPAMARKAAEKAVPGIKFIEAFKYKEDDGSVMYELEGEDRQGRDVSVEVTPQGKVVSISVEVELKDVPRVVSQALRTKLKGFRPSSAMAVYEEGKLVAYSFEGKDAKGEEIEVMVSADGSKVEIDDDES